MPLIAFTVNGTAVPLPPLPPPPPPSAKPTVTLAIKVSPEGMVEIDFNVINADANVTLNGEAITL